MAGWVTHCSLVTGGYYSYSDWVETTRHCPQCPLSTEHGTRLTSPEMRLYLEELEVWVLIVYQKSIISLPCQEPILLLLSNILLSIKSYIDRSAGAFETCIIRWNLLIFLCDLTHWHCPLCPKNVGFEIFNRKQFKNWVAISIFSKINLETYLTIKSTWTLCHPRPQTRIFVTYYLKPGLYFWPFSILKTSWSFLYEANTWWCLNIRQRLP